MKNYFLKLEDSDRFNEEVPSQYSNVFTQIKKYNPVKIIKWSLVGLTGLTALVTGTFLTIKRFHKKK